MSPCFTKASLLWALIFSCHPRILINSAGKLKPIPSPADLPDPGIKPGSPAWQADSLPAELPGKPQGNTRTGKQNGSAPTGGFSTLKS